jgi:hypothetical protein
MHHMGSICKFLESVRGKRIRTSSHSTMLKMVYQKTVSCPRSQKEKDSYYLTHLHIRFYTEVLDLRFCVTSIA